MARVKITYQEAVNLLQAKYRDDLDLREELLLAIRDISPAVYIRCVKQEKGLMFSQTRPFNEKLKKTLARLEKQKKKALQVGVERALIPAIRPPKPARTFYLSA